MTSSEELRMARRIVMLALVWVTTGMTSAADRVEKGTILSIDLGKGTITDVRKKEDTALLAQNTFEIRRNETVRIEILQNPLLFTYEAKTTKADTTEYAAALEFAKQLQALLALFPAPKASDVGRASLGDFEPDQLRGDIAKVLEFYGKLGSHLGASIGTAEQITRLKKDYDDADFEATEKRLNAGLLVLTRIVSACENAADTTFTTASSERVRCDGSSDLDLNASVSRAMAQLGPLEAQLSNLAAEARRQEELLASAQRQLAALPAQRAAARKDRARVLAKEIEGIEKELFGVKFMWDRVEREAATLRKSIEDSQAQVTGRATLASFAHDISAVHGKITQMVTLLVSVAGDVASLGKPLHLATVPHSIQQDTETIEVKGSPKYDQFLDSATRKKRDAMLRRFDVVLKPYQPLHLSIAPAFVLGFIRNPEFTAVKDNDAFKIVKKEEELNRYALGIMLNITPDAWQEPTFGGHFQVGISPVKDSFGFLLGAGFKAQKLFSFGAGVMLQQVRKLDDSLTMASRLDDPAKLKTAREFKRGLYLHISVDIPK